MKRGMTLLEVLLALTLLASLVVATTSWTTMAATLGSRLEATLEQESSAQAFLRLIHDDIAAGDLVAKEESGKSRVRIDEADGSLVIEARTQGRAVERRFTFDENESVISLREQQPGSPIRRSAVCAARDAVWMIDDELGALMVTLTLKDGTVVSRRYVLP